jgi:redox-sensing transcriptional repressor
MNTLSNAAIERLTSIYKLLQEKNAKDALYISSKAIAELSGFSADTVRKDISALKRQLSGDAIHPHGGQGYDREELLETIRSSLGFDSVIPACIVGLGRLGAAILDHQDFLESNYTLVAGFDSNINKLELLRTDVPLYPSHEITSIAARKAIKLGIIAVPASSAQEIADRLIEGGISGIINFTPIALGSKKDEVFIRNVSIIGELRILSAQIKVSQPNTGMRA